MRSIGMVVVVAGSMAACTPVAQVAPSQSAAPTPAPARGEAVATAHRCGVALGLAARCDLLRDDRDFAVLRFSMIQGLGRQFATVAGTDELTEILDLASLDRIGTVGTCRVPEADAQRLQSGMRSVVQQCVGP